MKTNKIEIPKDVFEKMFLQQGGERKAVHKELTGQVLNPLPENSAVEPNAEIEVHEFVKTQDGVKKALGEPHEKGGTPVKLEDGDRVLSDFLKVGGDFAKAVSKEYDINVKASDTYAKALDKYLKKIGHSEATQEMEDYIAKLDKQKQTVKDDTTLALNQEVLMEEIKEYGTKLEELEPVKAKMFDLLFTAQEATKDTQPEDNVMQVGGTIQDLIIKYNIEPNKLKELLPQYQEAGIFNVQEQVDRGNIYSPTNPNNPLFAGTVSQGLSSQRVANTFEQSQYGYQKPNRDWRDFGNLNKEQQSEVLKDISRVFPSLADKFLKEGVPTNPAEFQLAINNHYDSLIKDAEKQYPKDSQQYKNFVESVNRERFTIPTDVKNIKGLVTDVDAKFGDYTSTRPNFAFDVLPQDVLTEVKNAGVNTASELKQAFPNYYDKYVKPKNLESDFWLGKVETPTPSVAPATTEATATTPLVTAPLVAQEEAKKRSNAGMLLLPDQSPISPPSMLAPAKFTPRLVGYEYAQISPEQELAEIGRSQAMVKNELAQMPDAQRAATLASMDANNAQAISKVLTNTARYNAQAKERSDANRAQVQTQQSQADMASASQYQQLMGRELEAYDADLQRFYDKLTSNQVNNWKTIEMTNQFNALNPNVTRTNNGYEVINLPTYTSPEVGSNLPQPQAKKKPKGKKGGRFKK